MPDPTPLTVTVDGISADGSGRATAVIEGVTRTIDIPGVLQGETVEIRPLHARGERLAAELVRVVLPSPDRRAPACGHFGVCGGCALQHWPDALYAERKIATITRALAAQGVALPRLLAMVRTAPRSRRRVDLTLRRTANGAVAGFARRASHDIVDLEDCPVLLPQLTALVPPLRALAAAVLPRNASADAVVNWTETGADVLLVPAERLVLDLDRRMALAAFAEASDAARVSWGSRRAAEAVVTRRTPVLRLGRIAVVPPPGAFLQASLTSEAALQAAVRDWLGAARRIVDLYGGIGTLSLGLAPAQRVTVVEGDRAAVAAIDAAVRQAALGGAVQAHVRDLARDPLPAEELRAFDAAIFDPPRAGAATQAAELARSALPLVVAVSCDARSFARDARRLIDGGFRLEMLLPVDQFLWSAHVELAALFRR